MGILATLLMQIGKFVAFTPVVVMMTGVFLAMIFGCSIGEDTHRECVVGSIDFGFLANLLLLAQNIPYFLLAGVAFGIVGYLLSKLDAYLKRPRYTIK